MKNRFFSVFILSLGFYLFTAGPSLNAQAKDSKPINSKKLRKEIEESRDFARIDSLVNSRQFIFQAEFSQGSDMVFVVIDSIFGEVQNGNRNNLQGRITGFEVKKNEKKKNLSVTIRMRAEIYTADVFLFIGPSGYGKATVKAEFPGNFAFDGSIVDFENANIYVGPSHFVH